MVERLDLRRELLRFFFLLLRKNSFGGIGYHHCLTLRVGMRVWIRWRAWVRGRDRVRVRVRLKVKAKGKEGNVRQRQGKDL